MSAAVIRLGEAGGLEQLESALAAAFLQVQEAIGAERPVVFVVPSEDVLGHRDAARAAGAGALIGMCRAAAFEGARAGWQANVLAVPADQEISDEEAASHFAPGVSGQVVTLGTSLVGKVAP